MCRSLLALVFLTAPVLPAAAETEKPAAVYGTDGTLVAHIGEQPAFPHLSKHILGMNDTLWLRHGSGCFFYLAFEHSGRRVPGHPGLWWHHDPWRANLPGLTQAVR